MMTKKGAHAGPLGKDRLPDYEQVESEGSSTVMLTRQE